MNASFQIIQQQLQSIIVATVKLLKRCKIVTPEYFWGFIVAGF